MQINVPPMRVACGNALQSHHQSCDPIRRQTVLNKPSTKTCMFKKHMKRVGVAKEQEEKNQKKDDNNKLTTCDGCDCSCRCLRMGHPGVPINLWSLLPMCWQNNTRLMDNQHFLTVSRKGLLFRHVLIHRTKI
jgi:hypothetical protein